MKLISPLSVHLCSHFTSFPTQERLVMAAFLAFGLGKAYVNLITQEKSRTSVQPSLSYGTKLRQLMYQVRRHSVVLDCGSVSGTYHFSFFMHVSGTYLRVVCRIDDIFGPTDCPSDCTFNAKPQVLRSILQSEARQSSSSLTEIHPWCISIILPDSEPGSL